MSDDDGSTPEMDETLSTRAYLRLMFLNPISAIGIVIVVAGIALVSLSNPVGRIPGGPLSPAGFMLLGILLFAVGYTKAQHAIKDQKTTADEE